MIKVGCCGFPTARKEYFKNLGIVEVQKTFYKPPRLETAARWKKEAPPDFEFTVKAWQLITHASSSPTYRKAGIEVEDESKYGYFRPTREVFDAWERTAEIADALNAEVVVFQCPASFKEEEGNIRNMREFFSSISRRFIYAWEPRGKWNSATIRELCEELDIIHCVDPFKGKSVSKLKYFRLHGRNGYRYDYSAEELNELKEMCGSRAYCLFNNTEMYKNALEFKNLTGNEDMRTKKR